MVNYNKQGLGLLGSGAITQGYLILNGREVQWGINSFHENLERGNFTSIIILPYK